MRDRPRAVPAARAWRIVLVVAAALAVGWIVLTSALAPLSISCDPAIPSGACRESVTAALAKGLPRPHGLLLAAHVTPGPDRDPGELGHRATVTFDVLGAPAAVGVALYLDMGGQWGAAPDRGRIEVMGVPIVQAALIVVIGLGIAWLIRSGVGRGRVRPADTARGGASWNERT